MAGFLDLSLCSDLAGCTIGQVTLPLSDLITSSGKTKVCNEFICPMPISEH